MEGVEDIPFPVLTEGLPWNWESFPSYLITTACRFTHLRWCTICLPAAAA